MLDPAALATSSQALVSFWPNGDVRAGYVIIVLANLLELGIWSVGSRSWVTPNGRTSLWYSLTRIYTKRRRVGPIAYVTRDS